MPKPVQKLADDARQGVTGHSVRYVLFWGVGLAIAMLGVAVYFVSR